MFQGDYRADGQSSSRRLWKEGMTSMDGMTSMKDIVWKKGMINESLQRAKPAGLLFQATEINGRCGPSIHSTISGIAGDAGDR